MQTRKSCHRHRPFVKDWPPFCSESKFRPRSQALHTGKVGRVRVDVVGRVWVAVVVMVGGGAVVAGAVPVPATGGNVNAFKASSTLTG